MFQASARRYLDANSQTYDWLIKDIQANFKSADPDTNLDRIQAAAHFAVTSHTGRFADGRLENLALAIGAALRSLPPAEPETTATGKRRILHYTDRLVRVGGHTRMLTQWIREDDVSSHSIVTSSQGDVPVPDDVCAAVRASGGTIHELPRERALKERALWLRALARQNADLVVLHHCPWEITPTVAFAVKETPPVAVLNHADHLFWFGSSVADIVINLRSPSVRHTQTRRFVERNAVLPVPLLHAASASDRSGCRRALGIGSDEIVLLSVGRAEKYRPCGPHDFTATAAKILDRLPNARLLVIGESEAGIRPYLSAPLHPRLLFLGEMEDPSPYRAAADIYLESFPFGSQTALLEAALAGLPVVPAPSPLSPQLVAHDDALATMISNPEDEDDYIGRVLALAADAAIRKAQGEDQRRRLVAANTGKEWRQSLDRVYAMTDRLAHEPRSIPAAVPETGDADVGLCLWQVMSGRTAPGFLARRQLDPAIAHTVFVRQRAGDVAMARQIALGELVRAPHRLVSWYLLAYTIRFRLQAAAENVRERRPANFAAMGGWLHVGR